MLAGVTNSAIGGLLAARASQGAGRVAPAAGVRRVGPAVALPRVDRISLSGGAAALRDVGGTVDQLSRAGNTLAVAGVALKRITGLLDKAHTVLGDAGSDDAAKQSALDAAIGQVDQAAASARFGGRALLDGTFAVAIPGAAIALPAVSSESLGTDSTGGGSLASATTGGASAIASGDTREAAAAIDRASAQIDAARTRLDAFQNARIVPALSAVQSKLDDTARGTSSAFSPDLARTAALLARAQTVVQPERFAIAAGSLGAQNVLSLVDY